MNKKVLLNVESVYTANVFSTSEANYVVGGSETRPVVSLYNIDSDTSVDLPDCPGGVMGFVPVNGNPDIFYSIQGLYPGFNGLEAGVYLSRKSGSSWTTRKVMDLPFAHRVDTVGRGGRNYVIAVSCSRHKENPADWSKAGDVYVAEILNEEGDIDTPVLINDVVFRNHGMLKTRENGMDMLYISGAEGIFRLDMDADGKWFSESVFDREVSEFAFADFDADGENELVTIEPFHGNTIKVYKKAGGVWEEKFSDSLSFGHGLSAGNFNGEAIIMVGSRSGSLRLDMFRLDDASDWNFSRTAVEEEAGPTQTAVYSLGGTDYILSANQKKNEVAIYWK